MNVFGKALVVLILVMSIFFLASSVAVYSNQKNWKEKSDQLQTQLTQAQAQGQELQAQIENLNKNIDNEKAEKVKRVAALETERENLRREYLEREQAHAGLVEQNRQLIAQTEAVQNNMKGITDELTKLRGTLATIQQEKEQNFGELVKITDQLHQAQGQLETLKNRNLQLVDQAKHLTKLLDVNDINPHDPVDGQPPKVDGLVTAVSGQGLIEISLGSDDGLRNGHKLEVYRASPTNSKYLGRVEVITTEPDRAVAKILPEFRKGAIQKEDRVATRF